jgi:hypothetical protein
MVSHTEILLGVHRSVTLLAYTLSCDGGVTYEPG